MRRSSLVLVFVVGCAAAPRALPRTAPLVVTVSPTGVTDLETTAPKTRVVATHVIGTYRLGAALFVSFLEDETHVHLARVADDGTLGEVARGMPPSHPTMTRGGQMTLSGTPSALLGEPDGPIWMAFTHYNVFGNATMYRAESTWRCVGGCATKPDPERWTHLVETTLPTGERTPVGDLLSRRSRGHLFRIENRVSGEGTSHVLPRARDAVANITTLASDDPVELADGSIVDVAKRVPEVSRFARVDGRSADDFWVAEEETLIHVEGAEHTRIPLPAGRVSSLRAESDGTLWVSDGAVGHQRVGEGWRALEVGSTAWEEIAAARPHVLFVVIQDRLVRIAVP